MEDVRLVTDQNAQPFLYDAGTRQFILNGQKLDLAEVANTPFRKFMVPRTDTKDEAFDLLQRTPLLIRPTADVPLTTPLFYRALEDGLIDETTRAEVVAVMKDAYASLNPMLTKPEADAVRTRSEDTLGIGYFGVEIDRDDRGYQHLFMQIGGAACVCLQTGRNQLICNPREDVREYGWHNNEYVWQRQVLLAGIGHIASRLT